eukprot:s5400_g3.t1
MKPADIFSPCVGVGRRKKPSVDRYASLPSREVKTARAILCRIDSGMARDERSRRRGRTVSSTLLEHGSFQDDFCMGFFRLHVFLWHGKFCCNVPVVNANIDSSNNISSRCASVMM